MLFQCKEPSKTKTIKQWQPDVKPTVQHIHGVVRFLPPDLRKYGKFLHPLNTITTVCTPSLSFQRK